MEDGVVCSGTIASSRPASGAWLRGVSLGVFNGLPATVNLLFANFPGQTLVEGLVEEPPEEPFAR